MQKQLTYFKIVILCLQCFYLPMIRRNFVFKNLICQNFLFSLFISNIYIRYQLPRSHCLQCHKFNYFDYFLTFLWWLLFHVHTLSSCNCIGHMFWDLSHPLVNIDMSRWIYSIYKSCKIIFWQILNFINLNQDQNRSIVQLYQNINIPKNLLKRVEY